MSDGVQPIAYTQKGDINGKSNYGFESSSGDVSRTPYSSSDNIDDGKTHFGEDENKERGNWTGKFDFFLSTLGLAVGLGNVWRFPYLCYQNGGGVFFIPYTLMLFLVGIPIFFLELSIGQFSSQSALTVWKLAPAFTGIGVAMCIVSSLVAIYYNIIIAWSIYYMFASFQSELPWSKCDPSWTYCNLRKGACNATMGEVQYSNGTCYNGTALLGIWNKTLAEANGIKATSASEEYFNRIATGVANSSGVGDLGGIRWQNCLCLLFAWIIVFFSLIKSIKSSGKVVYFTALFPYVVLIILLIRGVLLDGHLDGIKFYLTGEEGADYLAILSDAKVWKDAASQIFFSLSTSWGGLIVLSSYNRFHNNALRDAVLIAICNCLTSFFAGFVIFSYLGFMAKTLEEPVGEVAAGGVGLAFVVYPTAVTLMPVSPLWSFLFFFMLITLGLDSEFGLMETVLSSILDAFPKLRPRKTWVLLGLCILFFLLGLTMVTEGGVHMLSLMDYYASGWAVLIIALFEIIAVMYVYGIRRFFNDIGIMVGTGAPCIKGKWPFPWPYWGAMWIILTPGLCLFILLFSWIEFKHAEYSKDKPYEDWAATLGMLMSMFVISPIPIVGLGSIIYFSCFKKSKTGRSVWSRMFTPHREWGPALVKHRQLVNYAPGFVVDPDNTPEDMDGTLDYVQTVPTTQPPPYSTEGRY